jgi:hypothetical protein
VAVETESTPDGPATGVPPDVIALFAVFAIDALLMAWQRRRVALATRVYRVRREFVVALDTEGGLKSLALRSMPKRRSGPRRS